MSPAQDRVGARALADLLGGPPPTAIAALGPDAQQHLVALLEQARDSQRRALDASIDQGLEHLPRILRRSVRLLLF